MLITLITHMNRLVNYLFMTTTTTFFNFPLTGLSECFNITKFVVPNTVTLGETVTLMCLHDLEPREVYTLLWYKNETEIYRFEPKKLEKPLHIFNLEGLNIDVSGEFIFLRFSKSN